MRNYHKTTLILGTLCLLSCCVLFAGTSENYIGSGENISPLLGKSSSTGTFQYGAGGQPVLGTAESETCQNSTELPMMCPLFVCGDINSDGVINILDVILCLQMVLGRDAAQLFLADMNEDSDVDVRDVILVLRKAIWLD